MSDTPRDRRRRTDAATELAGAADLSIYGYPRPQPHISDTHFDSPPSLYLDRADRDNLDSGVIHIDLPEAHTPEQPDTEEHPHG